MSNIDISSLSREEKEKLIQLLSEKDTRDKQNFLNSCYPDQGETRRDLYPKHLAFFRAGSTHKERAVIAGNRTGKSFMCTYEDALHLTGLYPLWWEGKRFDGPINAWVAGQTNETTRDILQQYLLGNRYDLGTGMIPKDCIVRTTSKSGIPDAIQDVYIKHVSGGLSHLTFKSYVQGVEAFMGTSEHLIHLDEEPTQPEIYSECLTRTMTTKGIVMCSFTPLRGLSNTVLSFLPHGKFPEGGIGEVHHG